MYDPQGYYEKAGAQGPYSVGIWSTWASGEPNGRPHVFLQEPRGGIAPGQAVVCYDDARVLGGGWIE